MTEAPTENSMPETPGGSMLSSPLVRRFLLPIIITVLGFALAIYAFSVPYLKNLVYSMEERAVLTNLNNVHELVKANHLAIKAYKESVLAAHKRQLKNITLFQEAFIKSKLELVNNGILSEEEAQWMVLEELRRFRYGNNNYVWVADLSGTYLSHPDSEMHLKDFSEVRDVFGNYVLTPLIEKAIEKNEGYHSYWWQRLDQDLPTEQLTYGRLFPQWGWVIGTGVFLDDLETEVILRKEKMIDELRQILRPITIARTGHMYIFDSWQNIIIHPDPDLENTNMASLINPATGKPLAEDLMAASQSGEHRFLYKWNTEQEHDHYIYDKIDWVKYVEGFDWYIAASVYTDELNVSSVMLRNKILIISSIAFVLSAAVIILLMGKLLGPIRDLSETARKVRKGDLTAQSHVDSKDEIGFLASSFNGMVGQLRANIEELDQKVLERTKELDHKNTALETEVGERKKAQDAVSEANKKLSAWVDRLEQHNREITLLNRMGEMLQACNTLEETYEVVSQTATGLFPQAHGALFMMNENSHQLELTVNWHDYKAPATAFSPDDCWGIRRNRIHIDQRPGRSTPCGHLAVNSGDYDSICLPLAGQNEILGVLHLLYSNGASSSGEEDAASTLETRKKLANAFTDHLAMAQANLKLRERLHHLSVRDGLTGLFNRRYMEETLAREFKRAERNSSAIGLIMLDVDFFKKFNDTYGHEAGDVVLKSLARTLTDKVRQGDVVCRYGGEEFVIILPGSPLEQTVERAETIRYSVENEMKISYQEHDFKVTISLGGAAFPMHGQTSDDILKAADDALYRSKEAGRNRVSAAPIPDGTTAA